MPPPLSQVFFYHEETMLLRFLPALRIGCRLFVLVPRSESQAVRNVYRPEIIIIGRESKRLFAKGKHLNRDDD